MPKYRVSVAFDFVDEIEVEAEDVYEANAKAESEMLEIYSVFNTYTEEQLAFTSVTAYDPELI